MNLYISSKSIQDNGDKLSTSYTGETYPGYMDQVLKVILNPNLLDTKLIIDDFEFDVNHLRTLLK